jgi:phosphate transport system protein
MTTSHTFSRFDQDLSRLRGTIITMSELVRQQFGRAIEVFCLNQLDGLALVEADERKVNAMHLEIDELCQVTIARHQPTAVDLRELVSAYTMAKISSGSATKPRKLPGAAAACKPISSGRYSRCKPLRPWVRGLKKCWNTRPRR